MKRFVLIIIFILIGLAIMAQDAVDEKELMNLGEDKTTEEDPVVEEETPRALSPLIAKQRAGALDSPQSRNIRALGVIYKHFGDDIPAFNEDFKEVKGLYVNAKSLFLRGDYLNAYEQYLLCREKSSALYKKSANFYREAAMKLLDEASVKALDMEIEAMTSSTKDEDENRVTLAQGNLRIAFEYYNNGDADFKAGQYQDTIDNCQAAKYYAISALINLEKDSQAADELEKSYDKDVRDALGQL